MNPNPIELRARIKELLVERLFLEGLDPKQIPDDAPLSEEIGLDSIDALELVLGLEKEFGVRIVNGEVDPTAFRDVESLAKLVEERLAQPKA